MKFKIGESRRDEDIEGQLTGHSSTSFIIRKLNEDICLPISSGSQMIKARECSNQIHSFPVHTVCLEFLPVITPVIW